VDQRDGIGSWGYIIDLECARFVGCNLEFAGFFIFPAVGEIFWVGAEAD